MRFLQNHDSIFTHSQALVPTTLTRSSPLFYTYDIRSAPKDSHFMYLHKHMYCIFKTCYIISMSFPTKCYVFYKFFFFGLINTYVCTKLKCPKPHLQKVKTVLITDKFIQQNKHTQKKVSFVMSAQKLQEPVTSINTTS